MDRNSLQQTEQTFSVHTITQSFGGRLVIGTVLLITSIVIFFIIINPNPIGPLQKPNAVILLIFVALIVIVKSSDIFAAVLATLVFTAAFVVSYYIFNAFLDALLNAGVSTIRGKEFWTGLLVAGALILTWMKRNFLLPYALLEISYAFLATWHTLSEMGAKFAQEKGASTPDTAQLITIATSLYLMVRGMTNFVDSFKKKNELASSVADSRGGRPAHSASAMDPH